MAKGSGDPADLGRGPLTRWIPVFWQAPPSPPTVAPFRVDERTTPVRFLLRVIFSVKRLSIPAAVLGIGWQVGEALVPIVMGAAIDGALASGDVEQLLLWLIVLGGVFLMLSVSYRFASQLSQLGSELAQHRLRTTLSRAVLHADGAGAKAPDGGIVSMMTNDVSRVAAVALTVYPVAEFAGIVFIAVSLLVIHWPLGLAVLLGAPLVVWIMGRFSGRLARQTRIYQTLLAATVGRATDLISGYRVIKGVRAEDEAARRYKEASRETLDGAYRNATLLGRFLIGSNTISGVFVAAVAALAGWFAVIGQLSVGQLIASVGLAQALLAPMRMLAMNAVPAWAAATASSARVLDVLQAAPDTGSTAASRAGSGAGETSLPTDGLAGPELRLELAGRGEVTLAPGEMLGLRADERTSASLLAALLNPLTPGDVRIALAGAEVSNLEAYRSTVTVCPHHATLFSGTIADNLLASPSEELREAALVAAASDDFVASAGGVQGEVGEMGNRLSGGQRQRLALARALATDAPVLVLHDPTTAVDSITEQLIAARLRGMREGRSTLVIASSSVLLGSCDRVLDLRRDSDDAEPGLGEEGAR